MVSTQKNQELPLVSVIVPVYNVELYLRQCLDSILAQTYKNLEIILVDDGSTDQSGKICDEYAKMDDRVVSYHQKNTGQASARNYGMTKMNGEYVAFIDSDDYVVPDYINKMMEISVEYDADLVQGLMQRFWDDGRIENAKVESKEIEQYSASTALREFCYQRKFMPSPWCKLIKTHLISDLEFPVGMGYEDLAIMYKLIGNAKRVVLVPEILYFYRQHSSSTMHNSFSDKKIDRIIIADQLKEYIDINFSENSMAVKSRYLLANLQLLMDIPFDKKYNKLRRQIQDNIMSVRKIVIRDSDSKTSIRIMAMATYLGLPVLMCLGRMYKKCMYNV